MLLEKEKNKFSELLQLLARRFNDNKLSNLEKSY